MRAQIVVSNQGTKQNSRVLKNAMNWHMPMKLLQISWGIRPCQDGDDSGYERNSVN